MSEAERLSFLRSTDLFRGLGERALQALAAACAEAPLQAGATLFRQGDPGDALYVVVEGRLRVLAETNAGPARPVGFVEQGNCVGEGALLLSGQRAATVRALTPCRLVRLATADFERVAAVHGDLRVVLAEVVARRLPSLRVAETELFGELDDSLRAEIETEMSWKHLARDEILFREGDLGDALYVVLQGRLQVLRRDGDALQAVAEIGRGEPVGEMALITREPRAFTVRAVRDTDLIRLGERGFEAILRRAPQALLPLMRTLVRRLRAASGGGKASPAGSAVALVPLVPLADLERLVVPFLDELGRTARVLALDAVSFDARHGAGAAQTPPDDTRAIYLNDWLHQQEARHDLVVYLADPSPSTWSARCVRQADRVILLARASDAPGLGPFEELVGPGHTSAPRELVLIHPGSSRRPSGTAAWLAATGVERHHHVRLDQPEDARRVARFLSGRAVGLVLSGGGARGFAHTGVIRALREAGVPLDFVGGTSMGSLAAGCVAFGLDFEGSLAALRRSFVATRPHRGYTLPVVSFFTPARTERALRELFGETGIEDLWVNFFCVATNITRGSAHVFRSGPLWRAMRASGSFPALLPPVPFEGDLLVDGGLLDNLPVGLMRALCPGPILASDVTQEIELGVDPRLAISPTPTALLLGRLRPEQERTELPGPIPVLLRSIECREAQQKRAHRSVTAHCFTPPVGAFGMLDFPRVDAIVEAGYRHTREALAAPSAELAAILPLSG